MAVQTSAGSSIAIATGTPATFDATGFAALSFDLIGSVDNIGEFGREYNLVTFNPIATRSTQKFKGSYNSGQIAVTAALDVGNAGQAAIEAARDSDLDFSFEVTLQDGSIYYFLGKVMSYTTNVGSVDSITMSTINIELTADDLGNDILFVPAP